LVERGDFLAEHANVGLGGDGLRDATRELDTIDGEGVACGTAVSSAMRRRLSRRGASPA